MSKPWFNLIDEPWLVVKNVSGECETISMRQIFHHAHEFEGLAGELPSQDFAIFRVLLSVLYRVFDQEDHDDPMEAWQKLWEQETLPCAQVDEYLDIFYDRFYLFDPVKPFFQVADLESTNGQRKPVDLLVPDCPAENSLFSMRQNYETISAGEAARWLIHCQAYDVSGIKTGAVGDDRVKGGKGYPIGPGWAGWLGGITVIGNNLRETLLLNLVFDRHLKHQNKPEDKPIWELDPLTSTARVGTQLSGQVGLLTWPQRRIRLFCDSAGRVSEVLICNGDPVAYQFQSQNELMTGWRLSAPQSKKFSQDIYMPREFDPVETVWRGFSALLPTVGADATKADFRPCGVLQWSADLAFEEILDPSMTTRIKTVGVVYGPQSTSWDEIFSDELAFNIRLASSKSLPAKEIVYTAVNRANEAAVALGRLAGNLTIAAGGDSDFSATDARRQGLAALDQPFRDWLASFDPEKNLENQLQVWTDSTRNVISDIGELLIRDSGPAAWVGRMVTQGNTQRFYSTGQAEVWFKHALRQALPFANSNQEVKN